MCCSLSTWVEHLEFWTGSCRSCCHPRLTSPYLTQSPAVPTCITCHTCHTCGPNLPQLHLARSAPSTWRTQTAPWGGCCGVHVRGSAIRPSLRRSVRSWASAAQAWCGRHPRGTFSCRWGRGSGRMGEGGILGVCAMGCARMALALAGQVLTWEHVRKKHEGGGSWPNPAAGRALVAHCTSSCSRQAA